MQTSTIEVKEMTTSTLSEQAQALRKKAEKCTSGTSRHFYLRDAVMLEAMALLEYKSNEQLEYLEQYINLIIAQRNRRRSDRELYLAQREIRGKEE